MHQARAGRVETATTQILSTTHDMNKAREAWLEYEHNVLALFRSTGYACKHNASIEGARGRHQIDIVVQLDLGIGDHRWLVECKKWSRPVAKRDVAAFRTIVDDVGADHGYLLSEAGFQVGAIQLARTLNLTLCNLADLTTVFTQEQLSPQHKQTRDFYCTVREEEDWGNMDSEAVVEFLSRGALSVADQLLDIHVSLLGAFNGVIGHEECRSFLTPEGTFRISVPWQILRFCGVELEAVPWKGGGFFLTGKTTSGEPIDSSYDLVFRTLTGPLYVRAHVPRFK